MTKKILFIDAFSTIHVGNGALLDNSFKLAKEHFNTESITIISSDPETNKGRYTNIVEDVFSDYPNNNFQKLIWAISYFANCSLLFTYQKLNIPESFWILGKRFKKISKAIADSDIVISISGESINDHFAPQMYMRSYLFFLCTKLKKEFYIFPQSIGPIFRGLSKKILRLFLSNAKTIFARDMESFKVANEIWGATKARVAYCPDVAITQESIKNDSLEIFRTGKKVIGITLSDVPSEIPGSAGYFEKMVKTIGRCLDKQEHCILMMPSNYKREGISRDYQLCSQAYQEFKNLGFQVEILENAPIHPETYQGIQKSLFLFISSRMHVGILATSAATPTIMLNTQYKIRGYMKNISMDKFVIEYSEIEDRLPDLISLCNQKNAELRSKLKEKNQETRETIHKAINDSI